MNDVIGSGNECVEVDRRFQKEVLKPYRIAATYLLSATVQKTPSWMIHPMAKEKHSGSFLSGRGVFSIPDSCYIDSTGHFNAVEFNICFNQLSYVMIAQCLREKLLEQLNALDYETFRAKQLSSMFIVKLACQFRRPIDSQRFVGDLSLKRIVTRAHSIFVYTYCSFFDQGSGFADGEVLLVYNDSWRSETT